MNKSPTSFNLPTEFGQLVSEHRRRKERERNVIWIAKPVGKSQGRGIFLFEVKKKLLYMNTVSVCLSVVNHPFKMFSLILWLSRDARSFVMRSSTWCKLTSTGPFSSMATSGTFVSTLSSQTTTP
jgi:hypothetical protein